MPSSAWRNKDLDKAREARRRWYSTNATTEKARVHQRRKELTDWFQAWKATLACEHCGESEACCLEFHHKNERAGDTSLTVAHIVRHGYSRERIRRIIEQDCMVLCANCHKKKHAGAW